VSSQRLDPDGQWRPATPIPYDFSSVDYEVRGSGPYRWEAFIGDQEVGRGRTRTRLCLRLALGWHQRRMRRRLAQAQQRALDGEAVHRG
jgi:hypothetical protein